MQGYLESYSIYIYILTVEANIDRCYKNVVKKFGQSKSALVDDLAMTSRYL